MTSASVTTGPNTYDLPAALRAAAEELARCVSDVFRDELAALLLFGDAVREPTHGSLSVSSVVVTSGIDLDDLRRLSQSGAALGRLGLAPPLALTFDFIAGSLDTFPLELLEIQQTRRLLLGRDGFADLHIAPEHLRLQLEREFKRLKLRMRQGLLASGGREHVLSALVEDVGEHLARTLRGLIWWRGRHEWVRLAGLPAETEALAGQPLPGLAAALADKSVHTWDEFERLHGEIEVLARIANVAE